LPIPGILAGPIQSRVVSLDSCAPVELTDSGNLGGSHSASCHVLDSRAPLELAYSGHFGRVPSASCRGLDSGGCARAAVLNSLPLRARQSPCIVSVIGLIGRVVTGVVPLRPSEAPSQRDHPGSIDTGPWPLLNSLHSVAPIPLYADLLATDSMYTVQQAPIASVH
jgi:hypothetical protein